MKQNKINRKEEKVEMEKERIMEHHKNLEELLNLEDQEKEEKKQDEEEKREKVEREKREKEREEQLRRTHKEKEIREQMQREKENIMNAVEEARKRGNIIRYTLEELIALKDIPKCKKIPPGLKIPKGFLKKETMKQQHSHVMKRSYPHDRFPHGKRTHANQYTNRQNFQKYRRFHRPSFGIYRPSRFYRRTEGEIKELEGKIRNILNKISKKNYDELRDQFCRLDIKDDEGLNKIIEILFEYAVKFNDRQSDRSEMYAKLCFDLYQSPEFLQNFKYEKEVKKGERVVVVNELKEKAEHFKINLLAKCQKIFYSSIKGIQQEEEEGEEESIKVKKPEKKKMTEEDRQLQEKKRKDEVRGNMIFIASLFNQTGLLGKKIIVEVIKKTIFDIYGLKKHGLNPKRGNIIQEEKYEQIINLCKFITNVGRSLDLQTHEVEEQFRQKARDMKNQLGKLKGSRNEVEKEIMELEKKGEVVKRQLESLYGFIRFLSKKDSQLPVFYSFLAKNLLDLRHQKWKHSPNRMMNQEILDQIMDLPQNDENYDIIIPPLQSKKEKKEKEEEEEEEEFPLESDFTEERIKGDSEIEKHENEKYLNFDFGDII